MKLQFIGDIEQLKTGIDIISAKLPFEVAQDGMPITVEQRDGNIEVVANAEGATIRYQEKIHFFRALGLLVENLLEKEQFNISEQPKFTMNGGMFDCSRNGVLTVNSIKEFLQYMAIMGLNMMMLYTEDIYEVEGEKYFGYMRGKYSFDELKEADDYADIFGIEIIPCMQTLGHLDRFLRWDATQPLRDTKNVLLADSERTYEFIEKMIVAATAPFRSNRIHIGMDEAHDLGRGRYLDINGASNRFEVMTRHLKRVVEITNKHNLKPMMWSDMFFRLASKTNEYFDEEAVIPQEVIAEIPQEVQLVLWDYGHTEEKTYKAFIEKHKTIGFTPIFAGGIHTWNGVCTQYGKTLSNSDAALAACKKEGVTEVFATIWGDNGTENNFFTTLLGLQCYAENDYSSSYNTASLAKRVEFCTGIEFDAYMKLAQLDEIPHVVTHYKDNSNPSKYLLWQDILLGLFDKHIEKYDVASHYKSLGKELEEYSNKNEKYKLLFDVPAKLCKVLELKSDMGIRIKKAYDNNEQNTLKEILAVELPILSQRVNDLRIAHRNQWFKVNKANGWEDLDVRYGGVLARVDSVIQRLSDYLDGKVQAIEELEEERLYFDGIEEPNREKLGRCPTYREIISANTSLL
jgi:hypothetical protein